MNHETQDSQSGSRDSRPLNLVWRRGTLEFFLEGYFVKEVLLAALPRAVRQTVIEDNDPRSFGNDILLVTPQKECDSYLQQLRDAGCRNIGILHVGDERGRDDRAFYSLADYVLRNYWVPEAMQNTGATP